MNALAKVLKGSDDSTCRKAAAASLQDVAARAAEASDRAVANLAAVVADAAETSKTAPAPAPAAPKKDGAKEPVPHHPLKRARDGGRGAAPARRVGRGAEIITRTTSMAWGAWTVSTQVGRDGRAPFSDEDTCRCTAAKLWKRVGGPRPVRARDARALRGDEPRRRGEALRWGFP